MIVCLTSHTLLQAVLEHPAWEKTGPKESIDDKARKVRHMHDLGSQIGSVMLVCVRCLLCCTWDGAALASGLELRRLEGKVAGMAAVTFIIWVYDFTRRRLRQALSTACCVCVSCCMQAGTNTLKF